MVPHVSFSSIQESLEFKSVRVPVGDNVADLADYSRENEHADQVTYDREDVPEIVNNMSWIF